MSVECLKEPSSVFNEFRLKLVVRLSTNRYLHKDKLVESRELRLLKRKSNGKLSDLIQDTEFDIAELSLHEYEDGIYEITARNLRYDIESCVLDSYELCLAKYEE